MSDLDDIIRESLRAQWPHLSESVNRNNALLATLMPPPEPPTLAQRIRYRVREARERLGEVIAGRKFDDWED